MEFSTVLDTVRLVHADARGRGLYFQTTEDVALDSRRVKLAGRDVLSFASCSYLGIEAHPMIVDGALDATRRYGTQFSASRGYLSAPLYGALEEKLSQIFGAAALVTSSTSIGHQITIPTLVTEKDAIILDSQVHQSVQAAATLARAHGATVERVPHWDLEQVYPLAERLAQRHRTVWFAIDGVYSMYGDLAPLGIVSKVLRIAPNIRLYVDDAHGMSWAGEHGRGSFLSRVPLSERIVVATSLNKAFSAGGGVVLFPTEEEREFVRMTGAPMVFSGPLQPPMLGAALGSADLHLSDEIKAHQARLASRVAFTNEILEESGIPPLDRNGSPIFFLPIGPHEATLEVCERMLQDGVYICASMYPSVPMRRSGIRLSITASHTPADIQQAVTLLATHMAHVMTREGIGAASLQEMFGRAIPTEGRVTDWSAFGPRISVKPRTAPAADPGPKPHPAVVRSPDLVVEVHTTIEELDRAEWDRMLAGRAAVSWDSLRMLERVFSGSCEGPENHWLFRYVVIRDESGRPVAAAPFTNVLTKADMFSREEVSFAVEAMRQRNPYALTQRAMMMGTMVSEGDHLYIDRGVSGWREALGKLLETAQSLADQDKADLLIVRDLMTGDGEMEALMLRAGLLPTPLLDTHELEIGQWPNRAAHLASLGKRSRKHLEGIIAASAPYTRRIWGLRSGNRMPSEWVEPMYEMYSQIAGRRRRINMFDLPVEIIAGFLTSAAWEVITLHLAPEDGGPGDGRPIAWGACHVSAGDYAWFMCGNDPQYVEGVEYGGYRQLILKVIERAEELGLERIHLGMDAEMEKIRVGARAIKRSAYVHARDHTTGEDLAQIVAKLSLGGK